MNTKLFTFLLSLLLAAIGSTTATAMTLNESCTVNIMNRTVQVQADGTWRMDNVPSFMGHVRARATCVDTAKTTSGQSEFFSLSTNNLTVVEDIFFDDPSPIPVALDFSDASALALSDTTTPVSLDVRATYSDGSFSPTLNASNGINFVSSNPNIVSVDENGVLMAVSSGQALITARLEGTVALKQVTAILSGDMDGDGLPDSYELANGLDPNDPIDALEDSDKDGLNALAEFNAGTDIHKSDTDNDGINDGEELIAGIDGFITNPLLVDTDGDGFSDGLEVDLATDPADSASFDLFNAMESIRITPNTLKLVFNGVDTEVSDQITVMANLIDGGQKDITASSLGTTYSSADLSIASFGVNDGEVFGGIGGTTTITASNNGYSDSIAVEVERFNPIALSAIDIPGYANNVDVQGNYAFVAAGSAGLVIVDVTDRTAPFIVSQLDTDGTAIDVKVIGSTVYLADGEAGIKIITVADLNTPQLISTHDTQGIAQDLAIDINHIYLADGSAGLEIINITDSAEPFIVAYLASLGELKGVAVDDTRVVAVSASELHLIDVSTINSPVLVSSINVSNSKDVILQGDYAYIAAYSTGYRVVNIGDFNNPRIVAGDRAIAPRDMVKQDELLLFAEQLFPNVVAYMNVAEPENTVFQGTINLSPFGDYAGTGISADNQYVYITEESFVVRDDYKAAGNTKLFIAQYRQITDNQGRAPSVNFIQPEIDKTLVQGTRVTLAAEATDDIAVKEVIFSINGEVIFADGGAPYQTQITIAEDATELTLTARAVDWGNNETTVEITRTVEPDTDKDGLSDNDELTVYFTLPDNPDTDNDGLNDGLEVLIGSDPLVQDLDVDADGLSNFEEIALGTDPTNPDTDGNGITDGLEDFDSDHLNNLDELNRYQTDPLLTDSDNDGLSDFIEVASASDPNDAEEAFVDPLSITAISTTPTSVSGLIEVDRHLDRSIDPIQLTVMAIVEYEDNTETINISTRSNLLSYTSSNTSVAAVSSSGLLTISNTTTGDADISVNIVGGNIANNQIAVTVRERNFQWWLDNGSVELTPAMLENLGVDSPTVVINEPVHADSLTITEGAVEFKGGLWITQDLALAPGANVIVGGDITANRLTLEGAQLTAAASQIANQSVFPIRIRVAEEVSIDETSRINANGSGYPSDDWSGPDFAGTTRGGCHGGIRNNTIEDCTYGRYEQAQFAGSGGRNYFSTSPGTGGGIIELVANELILEGSISANGLDGGRNSGSFSAGAGGGIHVEVDRLSGAGQIIASGGAIVTRLITPQAQVVGLVSTRRIIPLRVIIVRVVVVEVRYRVRGLFICRMALQSMGICW